MKAREKVRLIKAEIKLATDKILKEYGLINTEVSITHDQFDVDDNGELISYLSSSFKVSKNKRAILEQFVKTGSELADKNKSYKLEPFTKEGAELVEKILKTRFPDATENVLIKRTFKVLNTYIGASQKFFDIETLNNFAQFVQLEFVESKLTSSKINKYVNKQLSKKYEATLTATIEKYLIYIGKNKEIYENR